MTEGVEKYLLKLEAENEKLKTRAKRLKDENAALRRERDAARRGIMELYHLETITMSRARELMGETSIVPVRELYKQLRPEFDKELGDRGYAPRGDDAG